MQVHRELYRQIAAQVLVLHYGSSSTAHQASFQAPHNKLIFYLEEFKAANGINVGLIYTCFSKFRYHNAAPQVCQHLKTFLPYCERLLAEEKADLGETAEPAVGEVNESDKPITDLMANTLKRDQEHVAKLRIIYRRLTCGP